jgi:hypothetical protein
MRNLDYDPFEEQIVLKKMLQNYRYNNQSFDDRP